MTDKEARMQIIEIGNRMYQKNFVASNDGNISIRVSETELWITPTGVSKGGMTEDMLIKTDLSGKQCEGTRKPSTEIAMHLKVYQENPQILAVTHAHPPVATSFAIAGIALDKAFYPEALVNLGKVPVTVYATPGTKEVPDSIAPYCHGYKAVLLANHGVLTWGSTAIEAWYRMEALENYALITMYTKFLGKANELSAEQIQKLPL